MNVALMSEYVQYVGDFVLNELGLQSIYYVDNPVSIVSGVLYGILTCIISFHSWRVAQLMAKRTSSKGS